MSQDKTCLFKRQYPRQWLEIRAGQHRAAHVAHAVDLYITARFLRTLRVRRDAYGNAGVVVRRVELDVEQRTRLGVHTVFLAQQIDTRAEAQRILQRAVIVMVPDAAAGKQRAKLVTRLDGVGERAQCERVLQERRDVAVERLQAQRVDQLRDLEQTPHVVQRQRGHAC